MKMTRYKTISYEEEIPVDLQAFRKWEFSSGGTTGKDFKIFARGFKKYVKKNLPQGSELVDFNYGHYILSGFIKRDGKFVYFSISDVRDFKNEWLNSILVRIAKSEKDYTGGGNNYTTLESFGSSVDNLLR